jgi:GDP-D-mannose dehydratase
LAQAKLIVLRKFWQFYSPKLNKKLCRHRPKKIRPVDLPYLVCNNEKILKLGWQAKHQLTETLERILNYWRENL